MPAIPNHSQAARISRDVRRLAAHLLTYEDEWIGNSYGLSITKYDNGDPVLSYWHWNTLIAELHRADFAPRGEKVLLSYFNARYISATTRGFQGRILSGLLSSDEVRQSEIDRARAELSKPTAERVVLHLLEEEK